MQLTKAGTVAATSYNGIAAVKVDGGTICTMFSIFQTTEIGKYLNINSVFALQQTLDKNNLSCLIVDEVSTTDAKIIVILHFRLQQIMENNLPFGGIPIIFVGDFNQLGPVMKTFLPMDMMQWAIRRYKLCLASKTKPKNSTKTARNVTKRSLPSANIDGQP